MLPKWSIILICTKPSFSVNWNPSYDEQAQDRSYRIGQENDVEVIRLVARGTIEEQMYARQVYKVQLKKQTLGGNIDGTNQPSIFKGVDKDDKRKGELFGLENLLMFRDGSFMQLLVCALFSLDQFVAEIRNLTPTSSFDSGRKLTIQMRPMM